MNRRRVIVYVSGKYTDKDRRSVEENVRIAKEYAQKIWEMGYTVICPHTNTDFIESSLVWKDYIEGDMELIKRSDIVFMLPNWKDSKGAKIEWNEAQDLGLRVVYNLEELV